MSEYDLHYKRFPALAAYIDRVGAEQINFRRFMVKEYHGSHYYKEVALIKITNEREIECAKPEYAPTEEEAAAVKAELEEVEWPVSVLVNPRMVDELLESGQVRGQLFTFLDSARRNVIMCQERRETDDGKIYIPWTPYQAKNKSITWRDMEPDGKLPFWKPPKSRNKANYMVHEGAKTAAFCDDLVNNPERRDELEAHPFRDSLKRFEHWGAIGGALAPHRCDYDELIREKIEGDVIYACDHDMAGEEAAKIFSKHYRGVCYAVRWDNSFKVGWDLADKIPEALYVDPELTIPRNRLEDYMWPATWATTKIVRKEKEPGRPGVAITDSFKKEWIHSVNPECYCHVAMSHFCYFDASQFNSVVRPFSDIDDTARHLRTTFHQKAAGVKYEPGKKPGMFVGDDKAIYINTYQPSTVLDYTDKEARHVDYSLFDDYLSHLIPDERERGEVARWVATLIACPGRKMNYGLLLVTEVQGVGKTTLSDILEPILGRKNCTRTTESSIMGKFTDWAEKQLVTVSEIYAGHSSAAYDRLKEVITDKTVTVNRKFVPEYTVDNHVHVIATSNSMRALKLDNSDRRWLVPRVTDDIKTLEYWRRLHDWLAKEEGYRKIKLWAKRYVAEHGAVDAGAVAPWTKAKMEMIEAGDSAGMEYARGIASYVRSIVVANGNGEFEDSVLDSKPTIKMLCEYAKLDAKWITWDGEVEKAMIEVLYSGRRSDRTERKAVIRKVFEQEGFHVGKERAKVAGWPTYRNFRVISNSKELASTSPLELFRAKVLVLDIAKVAQELRDL